MTKALTTTIDERAATIRPYRVRVRKDENSALVTGKKVVDGKKAKYNTFLVNPDTGKASCTCFNYIVTISALRKNDPEASYECKHIVALRNNVE